ncbi:TetR/AcrR family transcriptional regulator [soil metagenome]
MSTTEGAAKTIRKDVARNRALLIEAAREVFAERGLDATLDDVARQAGVGIGTAYRHFANKQELAAEVLADASERLAADARAALLIDDPWLALTTLFETALARMSGDRGLHETLVQQRGPAAESQVRESIVEAIAELFLRAQRAGVIRPEADPTDLAPIFGMMGVAFDMSSPEHPRLWRRYLALFLDGLRADGVPPLPESPLRFEEIGPALAAGKRRIPRDLQP